MSDRDALLATVDKLAQQIAKIIDDPAWNLTCDENLKQEIRDYFWNKLIEYK